MPRRPARPTAAALLLAALASLAVACGDSTDTTTGTTTPPPTGATSTTVAEPGCSAAGDDGVPDEQAGLPEVVARTRAELVTAAAACDIDALGALAAAGPAPFTASFGGTDDPAELWRGEEASGEVRPLAFLAGLLDRPYATRQVEGSTQYLWPSAYAFDSWDDVPADDRDALRPLYDEDDFEGFAAFGSYGGYRIGISATGEWLFFVAGD